MSIGDKGNTGDVGDTGPTGSVGVSGRDQILILCMNKDISIKLFD